MSSYRPLILKAVNHSSEAPLAGGGSYSKNSVAVYRKALISMDAPI